MAEARLTFTIDTTPGIETGQRVQAAIADTLKAARATGQPIDDEALTGLMASAVVAELMRVVPSPESEELAEARSWARHGYEIGQRHCSWSDHGVAPAWLTEGWPRHFDSCEHLKLSSDLDMKVSQALAVIHEWQRDGEPNDYLTRIHRALAPPVSGDSSGPA